MSEKVMGTSLVTSIASTALLAASLALLLPVVLSSIGSDPNRLSALHFCTIDVSATRVTIGGDELVGLPDPFDFSRHKQVFRVYLLNYCSGYKRLATGDTVIDFCSRSRDEIWGLFPIWTVWGVNLRSDQDKDGAEFAWLDHGPEWLWVAYILAVSVTGLGLILTLAAGTHRVPGLRRAATAVCALAAMVQLGTAIAAQVTFGSLMSKARDDSVSVTASLGTTVFVITWAAVGFAVVAMGLRLLQLKREQATSATGGGMGKSGYVEVKGADAGVKGFISPGRDELTTRNIYPLPAGAGNDVDTRYEPYRGASSS